MRGTFSNILNREVSSGEFVLSNTIAALALLVSAIYPLAKDFAITAMSVGVAYGIETATVLWISGVLKGSNKNEFKSLSAFLKVVLLIIVSFLFLTNSSRIQELVTMLVYFISFVLYILVGFISIGSGNKVVKEIGIWEGIMMGVFLIGPLFYISVITAIVAAQIRTWNVVLFVIVLGSAIVSYLYGIRNKGLLEHSKWLSWG